MKPANFTYHRPRVLDEALSLLNKFSDETKVIAGGQSLVPLMNMRLVRPAHLVDINEIENLSYIQKTEDKLHIGALTRQATLEQSALLKESCPIISYAIHRIGHLATRQRGTIGGSLVHADPSAEMPVVTILFNANITITSTEGTRTVSAHDFFKSAHTTSLQPNEILTEVKFPLMHPDDGWSYQEFSRQRREFAIVAVATILSLDEIGKVKHIMMALGGAASTPLNVSASLDKFLGEVPSEEWANAIGHTVTTDLELKSDHHATSEDRLEWLQLLVKKSLRESLQRANIGER
jgi:2-furoyl-CoA dehydrogenase FAD binding subunit